MAFKLYKKQIHWSEHSMSWNCGLWEGIRSHHLSQKYSMNRVSQVEVVLIWRHIELLWPVTFFMSCRCSLLCVYFHLALLTDWKQEDVCLILPFLFGILHNQTRKQSNREQKRYLWHCEFFEPYCKLIYVKLGVDTLTQLNSFLWLPSEWTAPNSTIFSC